MAKPSNQPLMLDDQKLLQLVPPLSVFVTKNYGGGRTMPVSLPPAKNSPEFGNGQGYEHSDCRELATLLTRIGGGGRYRVQACDYQQNKIEWDIHLPSEIPDLIPPDIAAASVPARMQAVQGQVIPIQQPQTVQMMGGAPQAPPVEWMSQVPPGVPRHVPAAPAPSFYHQPQQAQQQQPQQYYQQPQWSPWPPAQGQGWGSSDGWGSGGDKKRDRDEEREQRRNEELRALREESIKREAQHEREKQEARHAQEVAALREEFRRLAEKPQGPDPVLLELKDALRRLEDENRRLRDDHKGGSELASLVTMMMNMSNAQQAQFTQLLPLLLKKDDGTTPLIIESMRQQADATREIFRAISEQMRERDRIAMTPKDALDMAEKLRQTSGADIMLKNVADAYQGVFGMTKQFAEMMNQMSGSNNESPAVGIIKDVVEKAGETVKTVMQAKRDTAVGEARAREVEAAAQITASRAVAGPQQVQAQQAPGKPTGFVPPPQVVQVAGADAETVKLFAQAAEHVVRLRLGVNGGQVSPEQAWNWIQNAVVQVKQAGWRIPAMLMLEQGQVGEFVEALVPQAAKPWKIELAQRLYGKLEPKQPEVEEDGGEEGEDEDEEEEENAT